MSENNLLITIKKVDKDTEIAEALLEFVKNFSWDEVKEHTVRVIKNWEYEEWETPFVAMADGYIVGMATIMKSDYYPLPEIYPWVSTLFVSEEYRGHRISEKLIDFKWTDEVKAYLAKKAHGGRRWGYSPLLGNGQKRGYRVCCGCSAYLRLY